MKKINIILTCILVAFIFNINVNATNYLDLSQYKLEDGGDVKTIEMNGHHPGMHKLYEDSDANIIALVRYQEENSKFADNDYTIPGSDGGGVNGAAGGTPVSKHAKVVKIDSSYKKIWETDFYQKGNWPNAEEQANTVTTELDDIVELTDGSYVAVGYTWGLTRDYQDDNFDAIVGRFDKNGNEIYRKSYYAQGLEQGLVVKALNDGGYVVKYYGGFPVRNGVRIKPEDFEVTDFNSIYHYVVYNNNNEVVDSFPESENYKLDSLSLKNNNDKYDLKYTIMETYEFKEGSKYLGTNINNEAHFIEREEITASVKVNGETVTKTGPYGPYKIKVYDAETLTEKRSIDVNNINITNYQVQFLMTNDGGFILNKALFDNEGNLVTNYDDGKGLMNTAYYSTLLLSNGDIFTLENGRPMVNSPETTNSDFANFIINGKKINYNLGTFLENDRTYINLNNLCGIMDCKYYISESNANKLIINFDIFNDENNRVYNEEKGTITSKTKKVKYTIVHEIGSKKYTTYLSFQPLRIFRLNSPTYDENAVDVQSKEIDGQIYVPLRFISEALGRYVTYEPGKDGGKPTITIGAYGEGDFYDKYGVEISYDKLSDGDNLLNPIATDSLELEWGLQKLVYGYGIIKAENKVINTDKTIFVPTQDTLIRASGEGFDIVYNEVDDSRLTNHYKWSSYESKDNWIGKQVMYHDDNGQEGPKYYGSGEYTSFVVVANIEGYPFLKIVNFK